MPRRRRPPTDKQQSRLLFRQTKLLLDSMVEEYLQPFGHLIQLGQELVDLCTQAFYKFQEFASQRRAIQKKASDVTATELAALRARVREALQEEAPAVRRLQTVAKILVSPFCFFRFPILSKCYQPQLCPQRDEYSFTKWAQRRVRLCIWFLIDKTVSTHES